MQYGPALIDGSPERHAGRRLQPAADSAAGEGSHPDTDIRLTLPAHAENVVLVRHVVAALAEDLGMSASAVDDVKLAVTEACTNVVRHAYAETGGALHVELRPGVESLTVIVTDDGRGLPPGADGGGSGLGLPLMAALADGLEIAQTPDRGSRVSMSFRTD